jgi:hypothetical protein
MVPGKVNGCKATRLHERRCQSVAYCHRNSTATGRNQIKRVGFAIHASVQHNVYLPSQRRDQVPQDPDQRRLELPQDRN